MKSLSLEAEPHLENCPCCDIRAYFDLFEQFDLFSDIEIKDYVTKEFNPDDVFSITDLETWADENDYVYKEEE